MDGVRAARVAGLDEQERTVAYDVEDGDDLGHVLRDALEHEDAEDGAQYRQGYKLAHGVEEGGDAACVHDERSDDD